MKIFSFLLLPVFFLLSLLLLCQPRWPQMFSTQDKINPKTLIANYDPQAQIAIFNNQSFPIPPQPYLAQNVLGEQNKSQDKRIEVDLTNQHLYGFENGVKIFDFLVSTGTWDRTPTGEFRIWTKIRSQKMSGGSRELGTYYYLPNVPYILFFYNNKIPKNLGYSLHGTYWHNNFGIPMSHGCINMKTPDVKQIFEWIDFDTPITISGKYQTSLPQTAVL